MPSLTREGVKYVIWLCESCRKNKSYFRGIVKNILERDHKQSETAPVWGKIKEMK